MTKLRVFLGIILILVMAVVFWSGREPLYEDITLNVIEAQDTPALMPGDRLEQDMYIPYDYVDRVSIAFSCQEETAWETEALVEAVWEGEVVMSQPLLVNACENRSFVDFHVGLDGCRGSTITLSVSNITPDTVSGGEFALMSTDREYLYIDESGTYKLNGEETNACIFCRAVCIKGYSYYKAATWAFLVFLAGGAVIERLTVRPGKR